MDRDVTTELRGLPPAHAVLGDARVVALGRRERVKALLQEELDAMRARLREGSLVGDRAALTEAAIVGLLTRVSSERTSPLRRVINATGVVLHTNLGRAPLGEAILDAMRPALTGYATLEYDPRTGQRGHRDTAVVERLRRLTGCEDAVVVNNGAAAVLLACTAFGAGRQVVVSRGELIEIGGGFRIPDILTACGAALVEVGTTNRTHLRDYARAMGPSVGAVLKVHRSKFTIRGFTAEVSREALSGLARSSGVCLLEDLGSGALVDTARFGLPHEPTAREALEGGADLVMVSGDKLLGGPQAGLIVGRASFIATLRAHPLMRALRPGRLVFAALDATLAAYEDDTATESIPALKSLSDSVEAVRARLTLVRNHLVSKGLSAITLVDTRAKVGGGTLPEAELPSAALRVETHSAARFSKALREGDPCVVGRVEDGAVLLDGRCVRDDEVMALAEAVARAAQAGQTVGFLNGEVDGDRTPNDDWDDREDAG